MLLKSNIKLMLKIKPNLENATELAFKFLHFVFIHHQFTFKSPSQLFFSCHTMLLALHRKTKLTTSYTTIYCPCLSTQPGRPWDILIFVHGGAPHFQYGTSTKELFKLSLLSLFCSLILLNSLQSVAEITNCKITINLQRSFFFGFCLYSDSVFSFQLGWQSDDEWKSHCTKIILFDPSMYWYHGEGENPVIQKGAICVTLNAIFKTIRHEIQVEIWEIWWRSI